MTFKLLGYDPEVTDNSTPNLKVWRASRFPFTAVIQEQGDSERRSVKLIGYLTVFNTPIPLAEVEVPETTGPAEVARILAFHARALCKDMAWFTAPEQAALEDA